MRVLIVSHAYSQPERLKLLRALARDVDVTYIVPRRLGKLLFGDLHAPSEIPDLTIAPNDVIRFGKRGHFLFRLAPAYKEARPDVIQLEYDPWTPEFWSAALPLAALYPRTPVILFTKKNTRVIPSGLAGVVERVLTKVGLTRVKMILAASRKAGNVYLALGHADIPLVTQAHLPVDADVFAPAAPPVSTNEELIVGYVGGISEHKGLRVLISALERVRSRTEKEVRFDALGPIQSPELKAFIEQRDWVTVHEPRSQTEVARFLKGLDVFVMVSAVLPDHEEHDGQAVVEAMATAVPCIVSRSGILPELVDHGVNGLVVDSEDEVALAEHLELLLNDMELRHRLGDAGRNRVVAWAGVASLALQRLKAYREVIHA